MAVVRAGQVGQQVYVQARTSRMAPQQLNVHAVLADITEHWTPRTIAVVNDYDVRLVKVQGCFTRHSHPRDRRVLPRPLR